MYNEFIYMLEPNCACAKLVVAQYYLTPRDPAVQLLEPMEKVGEKHNIEKESIDPKKKKRLSLSLKKKTSGRFGRSSADELEAKATKTIIGPFQ